MRPVLRTLVWLSCPLFLCAQAPAALQPDWDIGVVLGEIGAHVTRLQPLLEKIDAKSWAAKGASETYAQQLQSSKDQARAIASEAKAVARTPEKLSAELELYFRIQGLEEMVNSLVEGTRKYQDPVLAQDLSSLSAENGTNRNRFQTYIVSLAAEREQVCAIMDKEAQRCRSVIATQPPPQTTSGRKK